MLMIKCRFTILMTRTTTNRDGVTMGRDKQDFEAKMCQDNREIDALYEQAFNAMRESRRISESKAAALCIIVVSLFAAVMAGALWFGAALGGGV